MPGVCHGHGMMCRHAFLLDTLQVAAAPEAVYAIIYDTDRTPEWLSRCTGIDNLGAGPNAVGTPLRYHYKVAGGPARWTAG